MSDMPLLGRSPRRPRRRFLRIALVLAVLAGAGYGIWRFLLSDDEPTEVAGAPDASAAAPAVATPPPTPPPPVDPLAREGMRYVRATVSGPLETAFVAEVGRDVGEPLTQVVTRTLVWWVNIPDDLRRGDVVEVLFSERTGAEPLVHAVRFESGKAARRFEAYRFQQPGSAFARSYTPDGNEVELRLGDAPLDDHEQVTSLLRDGRGHRGVDFRVPVGTPVKATFDGVIVRKNWNFRSNGNCIELRELGGARRTVYLLHLSEVPEDVRAGDRVAKGQVIAKSGNTGRSFAPHLHYQVMSPSGKVLDPFATEPTVRLAVAEPHRAAFAAEVKRLETLFAQGAEARAQAPAK